MIGVLLKWLLGGGISAIGSELRQAYKDKLTAQNDEQRIEADIRIAELQAKQAVLIAEQGSWLTAWIRPALAAPVVAFVWKIIFWDTLLGWGVTPYPGRLVEWIVVTTIGAYFLTRGIEKGMRR